MNDTLTIKELAPATLDAANFPGTARSFPRISDTRQDEFVRQSLHVGSLSPCKVRIAHSTPSKGPVVVRSLAAMEQTLTRVDGLSNPIGVDTGSFKVQFERTSGFTLAEYRTLAMLHLGLLLENNGALLDQFYNREV